ncbi:MAG: ABC transporter ATP-binding protein [bacterium]|nr:ABC transporter ATP-binding protein [bacterium]
MKQEILVIKNVEKYFSRKTSLWSKHSYTVKAVDGVSFHIGRGEILGLVGESGCGKSTVGKLITGLIPPDKGTIDYLGDKSINPQLIFQDPANSLNPRMNINQTLREPLLINPVRKDFSNGVNSSLNKKNILSEIKRLIKTVGLDRKILDKYPHQLSGGQKQRVGIARALAVNSELIIADEPTSSLDVSIQAQILNLLSQLQSDFSLSMLFISHDLNIIKYISHRVCVMYLGKIVEQGPCDEIFKRPLHPYTNVLLRTATIPKISSSSLPSSGCSFYPRCKIAKNRCESQVPELKQIGKEHYLACHVMCEIFSSRGTGYTRKVESVRK